MFLLCAEILPRVNVLFYICLQDTVLGLQSLAAYSQLVISGARNVEVTFETNDANSFTHTLTADNAIITKKHSVCIYLM